MLASTRSPFLLLLLSVVPPGVCRAGPQDPSRDPSRDPTRASLEDPQLAPLAEALGAHRRARARGTGVERARGELLAALMGLSEAAGDRDPLSLDGDLGRAVWLSWERSDERRERGKVVTGVLREGSFAAEGLEYAFRLPKDYDPERAWPLILSIPDANESPAAHLREQWVLRDLLDRAILFTAAMPAEQADWDQVVVEGRPGGLAHVLTAQRLAIERFAVDPDRVHVVGRGKGVPAALAAGNYGPHRFAGIVGRAGDAGELAPDNFMNLPTFFAGGGAQARTFKERVDELGYDNCAVQPEASEEDLWHWMQEHPREANPSSLRIVVGNPFPTRVHWLRLAPTAMDSEASASIDRESNTITIRCQGTSSVGLFLNDSLVDLGRPVTIVCNGVESSGPVQRSLPMTLGMLEDGLSDPGALYVAQHVVELNEPPAIDLGYVPEPVPEDQLPLADQKRLDAGWVRQDLEWIPPEEAEQVARGLWKVDGEWLDLQHADRRRGEIYSMWHIPSRELLVHSTAGRAVALRAMAEMDRALDDLRRVFGAEPPWPLSVAVMRDEEQYDRLAFGDPDGRRPPTHVGRLHIIHSAYFAESWFERVEGDHEFNGMGVCYWDAFAPAGDRYGVHAARLAVGLSYVEALDPSPKAVRKARPDGPPPDHYSAYMSEKVMPAWLRYGGAIYAERYYRDTTVGPDGDPWWTRSWSIENLAQRGGLRPLAEVFAFPVDPDDRGESLRLFIECGLLVAFMVDGGCAPVSEVHEKLKRTLEAGRLHPNTIRDLEEQLVAHEAELRAFAGL